MLTSGTYTKAAAVRGRFSVEHDEATIELPLAGPRWGSCDGHDDFLSSTTTLEIFLVGVHSGITSTLYGGPCDYQNGDDGDETGLLGFETKDIPCDPPAAWADEDRAIAPLLDFGPTESTLLVRFTSYAHQDDRRSDPEVLVLLRNILHAVTDI